MRVTRQCSLRIAGSESDPAAESRRARALAALCSLARLGQASGSSRLRQSSVASARSRCALTGAPRWLLGSVSASRPPAVCFAHTVPEGVCARRKHWSRVRP